WLFPDTRIIIRGAGDLASGVAYRLHKAGFPVLLLERAEPLFVRRTVSFGNVIFTGGSVEVQGIRAVLAQTPADLPPLLEQGHLPVLIDPNGEVIQKLSPAVVVDARMQKVPLDAQITDAPLVVAMGPG